MKMKKIENLFKNDKIPVNYRYMFDFLHLTKLQNY